MTIAVAYRPDEHGEAALEQALSRAVRDGRRLVVINVGRDERFDADPGFVHGHDLERLRDRVKDRGAEDAVIRQPVGSDVVGQILQVVRDEDAELLVVGLRPRTPVGKLLLGSVAQRLLLDSPIPVLAVKPSTREPAG